MDLKPSDPINCLLVHTEFSPNSYWNYKISCEIMGRKTPSAPLGLITVAAILPQHWDFRLLDLNCDPFSDEDWLWADVVLIGGMLPQQAEMLKIIKKANLENKFVVAGGADPTSQPEIYRDADALVLNEGEVTIPKWLKSWNEGTPGGTFSCHEKPDVSLSPVPRYDLLKFDDYMQIGVQYSRGCPFNCEFCDIIELFGRKPRTKSSDQLLRELSVLYDLGYRGTIDLVDDNFIGNKRRVKRELLPRLLEWQKMHRYPFNFQTEASMNLADDTALLEMMRDVQFKFVFIGIESPTPEILLQTQKTQNTIGSIPERLQTIYQYGIAITAGFIMGFDSEPSGMDIPMIELIEDATVSIPMVGLLVALPNTQLTRRLKKQGRLYSMAGEKAPDFHSSVGKVSESLVEVVDNTSAGLNFETLRDRVEILTEFLNVVQTVYSPKVYTNRALKMAAKLKVKNRYRPTLKEVFLQFRAFFRLWLHYMKRPSSRLYFIKSVMIGAFMGPLRLEVVMKMMGIYLHFETQNKFTRRNVEALIKVAKSKKAESEYCEVSEQMKQTCSLGSPVSLPDFSQIVTVDTSRCDSSRNLCIESAGPSESHLS